MMPEKEASWVATGTPIDFVIGIDGLPYAKLPNEYEAEDYIEIFKDELENKVLYSCGGFFNGIRISETLGM